MATVTSASAAAVKDPVANKLYSLISQHCSNATHIKVYTKSTAEHLKRPVILAFMPCKMSAEKLNYWLSFLENFALEYASDITFAITDRNSDADFNLSDSSYRDTYEQPFICIEDEHGYKYGSILWHPSQFNLKHLCDKLKAKEELFAATIIEPYGRSKKPLNLYKIMESTHKDIFFQHFSINCDYDPMEARLMRKVARLMQYEDVLVVRMRTDFNYWGRDYAELELMSDCFGCCDLAGVCWPMCHLLNAKNRTPISYNSDKRDVDSFVRFIAANTTHELLAYTRDGKLKEQPSDETLEDLQYLYMSS